MKKFLVLAVLAMSFVSSFAAQVDTDCASMNDSRSEVEVSTGSDAVEATGTEATGL